jgi:TRAP transporter TAXI family solute receptor
MKKACVIFIVIAFFVYLTPSAYAQAHPEVKIGHLTAPFGGGSYVIGSAIEEIFKNHPWLHIVNSESPGYIFNIQKLDQEPQLKKSMFIDTVAGIRWLAARGLPPFKQKHEPTLNLANYNLTTTWLATLDPKLRSVKDLAGKKIALGRKAQYTWADVPASIFREGLGLGEKVNLQYVGIEQAGTALLDGILDACIVGGYLDPITLQLILSPQTLELEASGRKIIHISWTEEAVQKTIEKTGMPIRAVTIPANTLQGQNEPIHTFADFNMWAAAREFPDDVAYEFIKTTLKNTKKFAEFLALGKFITPQGMVWGWEGKDMHPGAYKAFKEEGLMK